MRVRLTRRALDDLNGIAAYIQAQDPTAASRVRQAFERAFALLAQHPQAGRAYAGRRRRFALRRYPYLIFYRINELAQVIEVTTLRHGAREPERSE